MEGKKVEVGLNFSQALHEMKEGQILARKAWNNPSIKVFVQFPDEHSANTLPYLVMEKGIKGDLTYARFPLDLSAESIFAEDWIIVN